MRGIGHLLAAAGLALAGVVHADEPLDRGGVVDFMEEVQILSLDSGREYCGYFVDKGDEIVATPPRRGRYDECLSAEPLGDVEIIASYHSHGAFSVNADSEVPSVDDILSDRDEGIDGYVVTPGGRVWFHDLDRDRIYQICGQGCVAADPDHDDELFEPVRSRYTLKALKARFGIAE